MYSLTIHFGPNAMAWSFLFKEKEKADSAFNTANCAVVDDKPFRIEDDFGQVAVFAAGSATGFMLEDLDLVEEARIQRSLANARTEVKFQQRARVDPVIRNAQAGTPVLTPMSGFRQ